MKVNLRRKLISVTLGLVTAATVMSAPARAGRQDEETFRARLSGFGEVPPKVADGQGRFTGTLSEDGKSLSWTLSWTGLTGPALFAHIHFAPTQVNGNVVVFFCGGGGRPACPDEAGHSGSVSGTWTGADIVGVPAQNVTAGDFAEFLRILRARLGYANIHTPNFPAGEIRGQVAGE